jgi:hypothetical protein
MPWLGPVAGSQVIHWLCCLNMIHGQACDLHIAKPDKYANANPKANANSCYLTVSCFSLDIQRSQVEASEQGLEC